MSNLAADRYIDILAEDDVRISGTRVGIEHLLECYNAGATAEQLAVDFPSATLEQIHGVIAYYLRHRPLVDQYLCAWREASSARQAGQGVSPDVVLRLRKQTKRQAAQ